MAIAAGTAALIGAGVSAASTGAQIGAASAKNRKTFKYTSRLAEENWARNLEHYHRTNKYNSPREQMKRLKEAGLNPNLVYGQGSGNVAGQASENAKYQRDMPEVEQMPTPDIMGMINQYQDSRIKKAQTDNLRSQQDLTEQRTINEGLREMGVWADSSTKHFKSNYFQKYSSQIHKYQLQSLAEKARLQSIETKFRAKDLQNYWLNKSIPAVTSGLKGFGAMWKKRSNFKSAVMDNHITYSYWITVENEEVQINESIFWHKIDNNLQEFYYSSN